MSQKKTLLHWQHIHERQWIKSIQVYQWSHEVQLASHEALEGSKDNTINEQSWEEKDAYSSPFGLYVNVPVINILSIIIQLLL